MSERKVLQKYYPPTFDPRELTRRRGPKQEGNRIQTIRLAAPFSLKCMTCGDYVGKGRKFNARKETPLDEKYLNIQIFYFHIKCPRCSAAIMFRTDPKNNDYAMVSGALRNEAEAAGEEEKNAMEELEAKNADARREMAAADALDEIRHRNARIHRSEKEGTDYADAVVRAEDEDRIRQEMEDDAAAKRAFAAARAQASLASDESTTGSSSATSVHSSEVLSDDLLMPPPAKPVAVSVEATAPSASFKRVVKKKKDHSALLGIKKKKALV
ncbi:unnamed protein product [Clonostachys rosea f. rosea IK726]|uniref:Uncharacterized protein n=1 Tax=Clonostachys rosea f. rosea IK726 TaxID=1349383 RepID=A0ACA9TQK3_BIOOC|nr:unnamed protein product [Clonostachys rosea f. rosea IK726]